MATPTTLPATFTAGQVLTATQMNDLRGAFRIMQVVQTVKTDTFSTTSATYTDVTGMTATITPSSTSSKCLILVNVNVSLSNTNDRSAHFRLNGGNSGNFVGDAAGNRIRSATSISLSNSIFYVGWSLNSYQIVYLDSPATTSATTYALQTRTSVNDVTVYVNRNAADTDGVVSGRGASSITVMEVSA